MRGLKLKGAKLKSAESFGKLKGHYRELVSIFAGLAILLLSFAFVSRALPVLFPITNIIGGLIATVPSVWLFYSRYKRNKEIEVQFILFITDITDSINAGMTLPLALDHCSKRSYSVLTKHINDMSAQVEWGIPFEKALLTFSKKVNSISISRSISTIIETYKMGGKISDALNAVRKSLITIDKIKKERSAAVHSEIVTGYLIFFIFIFIIVILHSFLIPVVTQQVSGISISPTSSLTEPSLPSGELADMFSVFIVLQGFFAGLATGKMSEGSILAGLKHSVLLIAIGYTIFAVAAQFPITLITPQEIILP